MKMRRIVFIAVMLILAVTFSGCEFFDTVNDKKFPMPPNSVPSPEPLAVNFNVDVYWDTTVSMQGFTTLAAGNVYRQLPRNLEEIGNSFLGKVRFFRFDEKIIEIEERDDYSQFSKPETYTDVITSLGNVIGEANPDNLSVVITDLFESNDDWSKVTQKCREKYFSQHLSIAIIGVKNSFNGEIFDVGLNAAHFSYNSGDDSSSFRPFYIFLMGSDSKVRAFIKKWQELTPAFPENEIKYVVFSEYFSSRTENLRVADAKPIDKKNLIEDRRLPKADDRLQEIVIANRNDLVSLKVPGKFQPYPENCVLSKDALFSKVKIFAWNEEDEWQEQEGKEAGVSSSLNEINDENGNNFQLEISFQPKNTLPLGRIDLIQIQIVPTKSGLQLQSWISNWDMGNIDAKPNQFDGSKTVNLKRIAESLKDSLLASVQPTVVELNLVIDGR